jgi:hypothetical protein
VPKSESSSALMSLIIGEPLERTLPDLFPARLKSIKAL